jgi:hypothetical protein
VRGDDAPAHFPPRSLTATGDVTLEAAGTRLATSRERRRAHIGAASGAGDSGMSRLAAYLPVAKKDHLPCPSLDQSSHR